MYYAITDYGSEAANEGSNNPVHIFYWNIYLSVVDISLFSAMDETPYV